MFQKLSLRSLGLYPSFAMHYCRKKSLKIPKG